MRLDHPLELMLLGWRLARPDLRERIPNSLFSNSIRAMLELPDDQRNQGLRDWLSQEGVDWNGEEPVLDAIIRRLEEVGRHREAVAVVKGLIGELVRSGEIPPDQAKAALEKLRP